MRKTAAENTNFRLKAVLDVLAEGVLSGESQNAGAVLAEALVRVPLNAYEAELLSGGIPRGHKSLTTATAKLVKAGWLVKGRSGWTITEDGQRATVAFPDAASFSAALDAGTPVPADTPLPVAAPAKPAAKKAPAAEAEKAPSKAAKVVDKAAKLIEDAVAPVAKAVRKKAEADAETAGSRRRRLRRNRRPAGSRGRGRRLQHPAGCPGELGAAVRRSADEAGRAGPAVEALG